MKDDKTSLTDFPLKNHAIFHRNFAKILHMDQRGDKGLYFVIAKLFSSGMFVSIILKMVRLS